MLCAGFFFCLSRRRDATPERQAGSSPTEGRSLLLDGGPSVLPFVEEGERGEGGFTKTQMGLSDFERLIVSGFRKTHPSIFLENSKLVFFKKASFPK